MVWQPYVQAKLSRDWGGEANTIFVVDSVSLIEQVTRLEFAGGITAKLGRGFSLYAQGVYAPVRHPGRKDGDWIVRKTRLVIYARDSLSVGERLRAAQKLASRDVGA
jgi:hypothetical protein